MKYGIDGSIKSDDVNFVGFRTPMVAELRDDVLCSACAQSRS